jgi:HSP20 family molecular chaperone IbpA
MKAREVFMTESGEQERNVAVRERERPGVPMRTGNMDRLMDRIEATYKAGMLEIQITRPAPPEPKKLSLEVKRYLTHRDREALQSSLMLNLPQ